MAFRKSQNSSEFNFRNDRAVAMVTAYLYLRLYLYLCPYLYLCLSFQGGPLFGRILENSFEKDQYHHCNHDYHYHNNALHTQGDVSEHFGCRSSPIRSLQSGSTDAPPPNEDLSWDVSRSKMIIMLIFTRPSSHWSSVTA